MDIDRDEKDPNRIKYRFSVDETDTLRAAHREKMHRLVSTTKHSEITTIMASWANFIQGAESILTTPRDVSTVTRVLLDFAVHTNEALSEIALQTRETPGFANPNIALRYQLGEHAKALVEEISRKTCLLYTSDAADE